MWILCLHRVQSLATDQCLDKCQPHHLLLQQLHFVGVGLVVEFVVEFVELGVEQLAVELVVELVVGELDSELEL